MSNIVAEPEPTKIYKVDSKGKMRYWFAYTHKATVITSHGIVGAEETSEKIDQYQAKPTNVGKKNERDAVAQAIFEVESLYKAKVDKKRYFYDIDEASGFVSEDVQLAQDYTKKNNKNHIRWGYVDGQFKLDGARCRVTLDRKAGVFRVWSRENTPYHLPVTLYQEVLELFKANPRLNSLDGELYIHGYCLEDISSLIKDVNDPERENLQLWVYDTIESKLTWAERRELISTIQNSDHIILLKSVPLANVEEARAMLDEAIELGFEGLMLRNWKGLYKCGGRSYDLQKWKLFEDAEFTMVGVVLDKRGHGVGQFVTKDGKPFNARWKASNKKRQELADHPELYVKKKWTIRFQRYTKDGIPLFPVAITVRDYE